MRCSMTCAPQPEVRAITNSGGEHRGGNAEHAGTRSRSNQSRLANICLASAIVASIRSAVLNSFIEPAACESRRATSLMHLVAWIGDRIDGVAEADDDFTCSATRACGCPLPRHRAWRSGFWIVERDLVGAAVLRVRAARRSPAVMRGIHVRTGARRPRWRGECRGVELVLGVEDQRGVHGAAPTSRWRGLPVQQVQEVPADRVVVGLHVGCACHCARSGTSSSSVGAQAGHQPIGDVARARSRSWSSFSGSAQPSAETPVRITSMGW